LILVPAAPLPRKINARLFAPTILCNKNQKGVT
jgi:hypothetical protein